MIVPEDDYPCVGVCTVDVDSGYCLGCGRPLPSVLLTTQEDEDVRPTTEQGADPDSEETV